MFPLRPGKTQSLPKNRTKNVEAHTSPTRFGMGDHYGSGYKQKMGRLRDDTLGYIPVSRKKMGTPPKSVV